MDTDHTSEIDLFDVLSAKARVGEVIYVTCPLAGMLLRLHEAGADWLREEAGESVQYIHTVAG